MRDLLLTAATSLILTVAIYFGGLAYHFAPGPWGEIRIAARAEGALPAPAQGAVRIAAFNASLSRRGPGMAWRAIEEGREDRPLNAIEIIRRVRPDVIAVLELDFDEEGLALGALQKRLAQDSTENPGVDYPYVYLAPVNTGVPMAGDVNDDGQEGGPGDAQGWGAFPGQYGMAVLSRLPLEIGEARSFRTLLWRDMPGALAPEGTPQEQRLSSKSHWDIPATLPDGRRLHLLVSHPTPPVFDGPEDRNGRRNHDEIRFWVEYIDGADWIRDDAGRVGGLAPGAGFVVLGDLNADPLDGDGRHEGIGALLSHPLVQDPAPRSAGGAAAAAAQGGANARHGGDPALDTADWGDARGGPGNLRVDYVLPSRSFEVTAAGVFWPAPGEQGAELVAGGRRKGSSDHRLVWVDLR